MVFDRAFRLVALITPLLLRIRKSIELQISNEVSASTEADHACIGHPVNFEGSDENRNRAALDMLSEAYGYADFVNQSYYPEPIAAALSYLHENQEQSAQSQILLAVDFGGGTLDLCLIRREQSDFEVIATHGIGGFLKEFINPIELVGYFSKHIALALRLYGNLFAGEMIFILIGIMFGQFFMSFGQTLWFIPGLMMNLVWALFHILIVALQPTTGYARPAKQATTKREEH